MRRRLFETLITAAALDVVALAMFVAASCTVNPNLRDDFVRASQRQESACAQLALAAVEQGKRDAARTNMLGAMKGTIEGLIQSNEELAAEFEKWAAELRAQKNAVCLPMTGVPTPTPTPPISRYYWNGQR